MEYVTNTVDFLKNYSFSSFVLLIIVSALCARIADWTISKTILQFAKRTKTTFDDKLVSLLHKPIYYTVFFLGLSSSLEIISLPDSILFSFKKHIKINFNNNMVICSIQNFHGINSMVF